MGRKRELDWDLLKYPFHDAFQKYFAHLCRVYSTEPALYDGEYNPDCFEWVACESRSEGVYAWLRKGRGENLLCIMNTQDHAHKKFPLYLRFPCSAEGGAEHRIPEWGGALKGRRRTKLPHHRWRCVWSGLYPYSRPACHGQLPAAPCAGGPEPRCGPHQRQQSPERKAPRCPQHKGRSQFQ